MKLTSNIFKEWGVGTETHQPDKRAQSASPAQTSKTVGPLSGLSQIGSPRKLIKTRPQRPTVSSLVLSTARLAGASKFRENSTDRLKESAAEPSNPLRNSPALPVKYQTVGMRKAGLEKDLNNALFGSSVPYLSEKESTQFLVHVKDGHLHQEVNGEMRLLSTKGSANPANHYLYVMDQRGRVFAAPSQAVTHHSAFLAGNPVAAAGSFKVEDGQIVAITDQSGHYAPPLEYTDQFVKEMKRQKLNMSTVELNFLGTSKKQIKKNTKALGVSFERLYPDGPKKKNY